MKPIKPYLKRIALDIGILPGSQDYVKFIILSRSRTGSEFLRSLLNSHSEITVFGELFQQIDHFNWEYPGFYRPRKHRAILEEDPALFLETEIFRRYPKNKRAIGFKIFYYHAQNDSWKCVWTYLQEQKDLRVIHLKRKNILETHLSRKRAGNSGMWVNLTGEKEVIQAMTLDYEECLNDFITTRRWEEQYGAFFKDHAILDISYEDLIKDSRAELQRVQEFLAVKREGLKSMTHKQTNKPLTQAIANYSELKDKFRGTEWAEFFRD